MSKISTFIGIFFASALFLTSCQQDVEVWDSATLDYSGRYVIKLMNEDMTELYHDYDGSEVMLYNTATNTANEMWLEDMVHLIPLKSKFFFTGDVTSFKSKDVDFDKLPNNLLAIGLPGSAPTADGQTLEQERDYLRASVLEGKIIPKAVTTKGGNISDSIYVKIKLYSGSAVFTSKKKPEKEWQSPTTPEYLWVLSSVKHDATKDEVLVIGGYRYTGYQEDNY